MRPRILLAVGLILMSILGPGPAQGSGLRDFRGGWLLTAGDLDFILGDPRPDGGPRSGSLGAGVWVGAGQGLLFSMPELPLRWVECGVAHVGGAVTWSLTGAWERLGRDLLIEDSASLVLGLGGNPRICARVNAFQWQVDSEKLAEEVGGEFSGWFSFGMPGGITGVLGLFLTPVGPPSWHGTSGRSALLEIKLLVPGSGLALRLDQRGDGTPLVRVEAMGRLADGFGVGILADGETGSFGGNLAFQLGLMRLQTSHLVHPALGVTHRFFLGLGDPRAAFP